MTATLSVSLPGDSQHEATPSVSVVIPSLDGIRIAQTVESLLYGSNAGCVDEIIVVGLDSQNLVPVHAKVRFICTEEPVSAARARNIGFQAAGGDIICFIDADCLAAGDWLPRLIHRFEEGSTVVGGGVGFPENDYWAICDNIMALTRFLSMMPAGDRPYLPSLNLAIYRDALEAVGGFDESYPGAAGEDVDLSFRLRRLGYSLHFEPQAVVYHHHGRLSARAVWRHLFRFGAVWIPLRERFPDLLGNSFRSWLSRKAYYLFLLSIPGAVLVETALLFLRAPVLLRYWYTAPGLVWCKLAWYAGAASHLGHSAKPS